eukprot:3778575-Amphidinium_carterae.2
MSAPWPTWEFQQSGDHIVFVNMTAVGELREEFTVNGPSFALRTHTHRGSRASERIIATACWTILCYRMCSVLVSCNALSPRSTIYHRRRMEADGVHCCMNSRCNSTLTCF